MPVRIQHTEKVFRQYTMKLPLTEGQSNQPAKSVRPRSYNFYVADNDVSCNCNTLSDGIG